MAVIASWNGRTWESRKGRIFTISGFATGSKAKTETDNDSKGSAAQKVIGKELEQISFSTTSGFMVGVDMRKEYLAFRGLVNKSAPFILGGQRIGAAKYRLDDVQISDIVMNGRGLIVSATLAFTFVEDAAETAKSKEKNAPDANARTSALYVGPSAEDKLQLRMDN